MGRGLPPAPRSSANVPRCARYVSVEEDVALGRERLGESWAHAVRDNLTAAQAFCYLGDVASSGIVGLAKHHALHRASQVEAQIAIEGYAP